MRAHCLEHLTQEDARIHTNAKNEGFTKVYDLVSVAPYPNYYGKDLTLWVLDIELEGVFSTAHEELGYYSAADFIALATNLGLTPVAARSLITQLCKDVAKNYIPLLAASACHDKDSISSHIQMKLRRVAPDIPLPDGDL